MAAPMDPGTPIATASSPDELDRQAKKETKNACEEEVKTKLKQEIEQAEDPWHGESHVVKLQARDAQKEIDIFLNELEGMMRAEEDLVEEIEVQERKLVSAFAVHLGHDSVLTLGDGSERYKEAKARRGTSIAEEELSALKKRLEFTKAGLEKFTGVQIEGDAPTVSLCFSGGGYRYFCQFKVLYLSIFLSTSTMSISIAISMYLNSISHIHIHMLDSNLFPRNPCAYMLHTNYYRRVRHFQREIICR